MSGFENPSLNRNENEVLKNIEAETLDAIKDGTALPTPRFLKNDIVATTAFENALKESHKLHKSLELLTPEEKILFLKVFNEALEKQSVDVFFDGLHRNGYKLIAGGGVAGLAYGVAGLGMGGVILASIPIAAGVITSAIGIFGQEASESHKKEIRELIISAVTN